jgi:predicted TIM-barrel fold metal-dependent hydrolase
VPKTKPAAKIIALEEAFLHPKLLELYDPNYVKLLNFVRDKLMDVGPERIKRMDAAGIDMQVLSHAAPGVQTLEPDMAISLAREVNDWLGDIVRQYPTRFAAFASVATQSPKAAADELERTVAQLGFKGALINGHSNGRYLDEKEFWPILERAQALDVPIYLHPYIPPENITKTYYPTPGMAQGWGWMVDTGTHVLRLMASGTFDRYPRLKVIVGHMGELIPFNFQRLNKGMSLAEWILAGQEKKAGMQKSVLNYMRQNVYITTSGSFDHAALQCTIAQLGIDHIMFAADDPFSDNIEAVDFLRDAELSRQDKEKLAYGNAERLLRLSATDQTGNMPSDFKTAAFNFKARLKSKMASALLGFLVK